MEYNIRVYKPELKQEEGKINNLRGFATITFDEDFCVKSLAIKESSKGNLYLDMPRYRDYETGEYVPFYRFAVGVCLYVVLLFKLHDTTSWFG